METSLATTHTRSAQLLAVLAKKKESNVARWLSYYKDHHHVNDGSVHIWGTER
jgi:hypothetical protein